MVIPSIRIPRAVSKSRRAEAEEGERPVGVGAVVAEGVGDVRPAVGAQDGEGEVAQRRQRVGRIADPGLPGILPEGDVAPVVDAVLDRPVATPEPLVGSAPFVYRWGLGCR